ncbi:DUF1822 family protein [Candidatus Cyanaurora vandensis]|uniref:DUF1822 family protein n=1 Tax=Candidatus Cyanaurora vandensis TaxID=2714958 RepID=UPI00257FE56A|nr:DUF1822 family protein [Candidatus Cyanaurora vandensis]
MSDSASTFEDPTALFFEIPALLQAKVWQTHTVLGDSVTHWQAYLNDLTLQVLLPWVQAYDAQAQVMPQPLPYWTVVTGTALTVAGQRWVLIPAESDDLQVPQEWVDIPQWRADYYLAVTVDLAQHQLRVWAWATHHQLKTQGQYYSPDRTYSLHELDLVTDLGALWAVTAGCLTLDEPTLAPVPLLPVLTTTQAHSLLQRLAQSLLPRLEVPFALWGSLLAHGGWRQALYEGRQGLPEQWSLPQWLRGGVSPLGQAWGWLQVSVLAESRDQEVPKATFVRPLQILNQEYELRVLPLGLGWRFQLRPVLYAGQIPTGFVLSLWTEDQQSFAGNIAHADAPVPVLYIDVALEPGEGIIWQVEPTPAAYCQEILRF